MVKRTIARLHLIWYNKAMTITIKTIKNEKNTHLFIDYQPYGTGM